MTQVIKAVATKPDDPTLLSGTHMVEKRERIPMGYSLTFTLVK